MMQGDRKLSGSSQKRSLSSVIPATITGNARLDPLALGVVGMDNRQAVIIDIGAVLTKVGYAGEFVPRAIIRTELVDDRTGETIKVLDDTLSEQELYYRLVKFFRELFFRYLLTVARDRRIVIVESILARTSHRNAMARVLFNAFDAPSVLFAPSHLLATFPFGVTNAIVIDVGYSEATIVPILEGVTMLYQLETSCIGAKCLEERVYELLRKYGKVLTISGTERALTDDDDLLLKKERILEDIVVRFCFATKMDRGKMIHASEYNPEREIPKPPCDVRLPFGEEMLIVPGLIREWTAEAIFEENDDIKSLPQLVLDAVYRCPIDMRRKLLDSIILVGGTTRMKGFSARLRDEILRLLTASAYANKLGNIKSVKFYRLPNTSIELYASWIGGSMFGALEVLQYYSLTREDWQRRGKVPDWTNNVHEMNRDSIRNR
ncbi:actin [Loa loa]|uniref:Actin n=1 Tax=Loa loa TaxID=7209 RepID=A0A1S0TXM5_LOALO|nr:actin [Loa loa]EFO22014.2 actin [Loa loa]